jgi:hypothetical protein
MVRGGPQTRSPNLASVLCDIVYRLEKHKIPNLWQAQLITTMCWLDALAMTNANLLS